MTTPVFVAVRPSHNNGHVEAYCSTGSSPVFVAVRPSHNNGHVEAYCSTGSSPGSPTGTSGCLPVRLDLDHRGHTDVIVRYELHGPPSARPVVVLGGISAHRHLSPTGDDPSHGWWPGVVGPGSALDTRRSRVIGVDYLGGPGTPLPGSGPVTTRDQARAVLAVLRHLGIDHASFVGASYGGMVALALALLAPDSVSGLLLLCAAHRTHPMATAVRALQRDITRLGLTNGGEREALSLARSLAMTTYRSSLEFEERFDREWTHDAAGQPRFSVEAYLAARGRAFAERFPSGCFLQLSESIDLHDVDPSLVDTPTTLVSWDSDALVPPWLVAELKERFGGPCAHIVLSSPFGHDAFLKEARDVSSVLSQSLQAGEVAS